MEDDDKTTEWALLFPLKAGLFPVKSSTMSRTESRKAHHHLSALGLNIHKKVLRKKSSEAEPDMEPPTGQRLRMRRGSSMSELDKIQSAGGLPDLIRSSTNQSQLGSAQSTLLLKGYGSVPHSPAMSRNLISVTRTYSNQGSIGDLMNLKRFGGSSWSVRSETLIAKAVPLSTVTPKLSPGSPPSPPTPPPMPRPPPTVVVSTSAMTAAQRTQRLSRLLRDTRPPATPPKRKVKYARGFSSTLVT